MAIVKHIKSRNANYSAAINYLLFEDDEKTGKKIVDESGRSILRKEFYMDGLSCDPMSFDKECELTNAHFHKNKKREDIKSHHYIISYDPADVTENGLTGERAQAISLELAKQMFPGYQALVVTHTDGHNESGNIHTHIVINSVRMTAVERQPYMDKPHEEAAGYKHRSTDKFMNAFKKTVMDRCQQEGLHQIDLLAPAERKITQKEYMSQKHGQQKLDEINQKIIEDGLKPTSTVFLTQKEYLRNAIDECAATSNSFDEFQSKLLEQFQISVIEHRGRYSYLHPDRQKRITERALGTRYGKEHLEQTFLRKDPLVILYVRSHLRLVVNLQTNVKAMQSPAYAHRVKLSNLQQMANTIIYVQEHGFDTQSDLKNTLLASKQELKEMQTQFAQHRSDLRILNDQMPYDCVLKPGEVARIPLGFGLIIPDGFAGYVFPRSSMAAKGLVCELPPIDSGYRGEIHAIISNVSTSSQIIHKDTRVGQLVITPVVIADFVLDLGEERGTGAFGSTGE